jgi:lysophospholipase L1-like esterase
MPFDKIAERIMKSMKLLWLFVFLIPTDQNYLFAQDPLRFSAEVTHLDSLNYDFDLDKDIYLFTGSSSIRKWDSLSIYFPDYQIINNGFGGSQMSDLLYYSDLLILKYAPDKVFIYEGDNDLAEEKEINEIMATAKKLVKKLRKEKPGIEIVFISAKPSLARWEIKNQYLALNKALSDYCSTKSFLTYVNLWDLMLDENGEPEIELFVEDGLHLNEKGYDLWAEEIGKYLE